MMQSSRPIRSPRATSSPGESDIVDRRTAEAVPVAVYDGLTAKGEELLDVLSELDGWAKRWGEEVPEGLNPRLRD